MAAVRRLLSALVIVIVTSGAQVSATQDDVGVRTVSGKDAPRYQGAVRPVRLDPSVGASAEQLDAQFEVLSRISDARVVYTPRGTPKRIMGRSMFGVTPHLQLPRDQEVVNAAIRQLRVAYLAAGTEQLTIERISKGSNGGELVILNETIRGIPIWGTKIVIRTHPETGWVEAYGEFLPDRNLVNSARISQADAHAAALRWSAEYERVLRTRPQIVTPEGKPLYRENDPSLFNAADVTVTRDAALYYMTDSSALVWFVEVGDGRDFNQRLGVDSQSGEVLFNNETAAYIGTRKLYDSNGPNVPGTLIFQDPNWTSDTAAQDAWANVTLAHNNLLAFMPGTAMNVVEYRISIDYVGASRAQLFPGVPYHEVRLQQPGTEFGRTRGDAAIVLDVAAHEVTHLLQSHGSGLMLCTSFDCAFGASGIAEGLADVAATKADMANTKPAPWVVGDTFSDGLGYRNASSPTSGFYVQADWYPRHHMYSAHANATIVSHAHYLLSNSGYHARAGTAGIPSIAVSGLGQTAASTIFLDTLTGHQLLSTSKFMDLRTATLSSALTLYGAAAQTAVGQAWDAVGVTACTPPATAPSTPSMFSWPMCPFYNIGIYGVPNATVYQIQYSFGPSFSSPGNLHSGDEVGCQIQVTVNTYLRARACNTCGCSGWSNSVIAQPFIGECP